MADAVPSSRTPLRHSASLKQRSSKRKNRKSRRLSSPDTSSSVSPFTCCFYPERSPEKEFWGDVVFITPQGTPKLSSRHSTLNFNVIVTQGIEQRPCSDVISQGQRSSVSGSQSRDSLTSCAHVVQAEIPPFRPNITTAAMVSTQHCPQHQHQHIHTCMSPMACSRTTACVAAVQAHVHAPNDQQQQPPQPQQQQQQHVCVSSPRTETPPTVTIPPFRDQTYNVTTPQQQALMASARQVPVTGACARQVPSERAQQMPGASGRPILCKCGRMSVIQAPLCRVHNSSSTNSTNRVLTTYGQSSMPDRSQTTQTVSATDGTTTSSAITFASALDAANIHTPSSSIITMSLTSDPATSTLTNTQSLSSHDPMSVSETTNVPTTVTIATPPADNVIPKATPNFPADNTQPDEAATNCQPEATDVPSSGANISQNISLNISPTSQAVESARSQSQEGEENNSAKSQLIPETQPAKNNDECQHQLESLAGKNATEMQTEHTASITPQQTTSRARELSTESSTKTQNQTQTVVTSVITSAMHSLVASGLQGLASTTVTSSPPVTAAITTSHMPITVPTALGQIVLNSPPIMSTGISGPIVSSQVSTGSSQISHDYIQSTCKLHAHSQSAQKLQNTPTSSSKSNTPPVSRYVSFTCSSVKTNTVRLKPVASDVSPEKYRDLPPTPVSFDDDEFPPPPSDFDMTDDESDLPPPPPEFAQGPIYTEIVVTTTAQTTAPVHTCAPMPVYAKVSKPAKNNGAENKQGASCSSQSTNLASDSIDSSETGKQGSEGEPKKRYRRPAPAIPDVANVNQTSKEIPCACVSRNISIDGMDDGVKIDSPPVVMKTKEELMQEVMENKPQVENLVLVKRTPSQQPANTPKLLRRSQGSSQTMRRPVIKGPERQRLTKSIESLEDVVLDLDIAYEFVHRKNYRTSFIGDVSPCQANKQRVYEDNSFGDVQTLIKHTKQQEPIYALPQPACFGEDTMQAVKRITEKYNTPQRWKLQAKSFESSLQRPTTVTMAGTKPCQQPHMVMATPPSISAPYTRERARLGLFYRSHAAEICICDCLAELRQRCGPNEPWVPTHSGRPILVFNTGQGRRRRQLELVLADSNTALPLWSDFITYLSEFRPVDTTNPARPVHQLRLSTNLRIQVLIEYYNAKAAEEFYSRFLAITADPSDTLWMVSGDRSSLKKGSTTKRKKLSNKSLISQPCHFAHVTHMEAVRVSPEMESQLSMTRVRSRSSETLN